MLYDDITDGREDNIYFSFSKSELAPWRQDDYRWWQQTQVCNLTFPVMKEEIRIDQIAGNQ